MSSAGLKGTKRKADPNSSEGPSTRRQRDEIDDTTTAASAATSSATTDFGESDAIGGDAAAETSLEAVLGSDASAAINAYDYQPNNTDNDTNNNGSSGGSSGGSGTMSSEHNNNEQSSTLSASAAAAAAAGAVSPHSHNNGSSPSHSHISSMGSGAPGDEYDYDSATTPVLPAAVAASDMKTSSATTSSSSSSSGRSRKGVQQRPPASHYQPSQYHANDVNTATSSGSSSSDSSSSSETPSRSLYLGGVRAEQTSYFDLCRLANHFGPLESVKIISQKNCAFVNFIDIDAARGFYNKNLETPLQLGNTPLKVGWGRASGLPADLAAAVSAGASRALYITNLPTNSANESSVISLMRAYGEIENLLVQTDKRAAFINMTDISNAIKAQKALDGSNMAGNVIRVGFTKEGQLHRPPSFLRHGAVAPPLSTSYTPPPGYALVPTASTAPPSAPSLYPTSHAPPLLPPTTRRSSVPSIDATATYGGRPPVSAPPPPSLATATTPVNSSLTMVPDGAGRGLYLGNVSPDISAHELCKLANRYGPLDCLKLMREKMCAFLNFIDAESAMQMFADMQNQPAMINGVALKCGWARGSKQLPPDIAVHVRAGASRALFLSGLGSEMSEEELHERFKIHGEIDCIISQFDKGTALISFISLRDAVTARNALNGQMIGSSIVKIDFTREGTLVVPDVADPPVSLFASSSTSMMAPVPVPTAVPVSSVRGASLTNAVPSSPSAAAASSSASLSIYPSSSNSGAYDDLAPLDHQHTDSYDDASHYAAEAASYRPPPSPHGSMEAYGGALLPTPTSPSAQITPPTPPPAAAVAAPATNRSQARTATTRSATSAGTDPTAAPSRALFIGGVPSDCTYHDICTLANKFGCIESVRMVAEKGHAFLHFYSTEEAMRMWEHAQSGQPLLLRGSAIRLGWGKAPILGPDVAELLRQGATRNLFVGGVSDDITEQQIRDLFGAYSAGQFDQINILRGKKIAFVHMPSLRAAVAARQALDNQTIGSWRLKVNFAREAGHGGTPHQPTGARGGGIHMRAGSSPAPPPAAAAAAGGGGSYGSGNNGGMVPTHHHRSFAGQPPRAPVFHPPAAAGQHHARRAAPATTDYSAGGRWE